MRIGLLTTYLALGPVPDSGIGQHYLILADALAAQGHSVHVIHPTLHPRELSAALAAYAPRWTCDIVPVHPSLLLDRALRASWPSRVLMAELFSARAASSALTRAATLRRLEIIETHATTAPALLYLQHLSRPPVLTRVSTTMSQMNATSAIRSRVKTLQAALERLAVRSSDALVTHTRQHRDAICALDGYHRRSFALVPHGLPDLSSPPPPPPPPSTAPEILFVGRFEHRKGIDILLAAIPLVLAAFPAARFTLAGSFGDGAAWQSFAARHPRLLDGPVTALGPVSPADLETLYARCDLLVAPSRYESFGLVYVEAMRHAKPVLGTDVGGIPEVVTRENTGLLARPGDVHDLVACLLRLLRDPALRHRLGQAGRADFAHRFSASRMASDSVKLYQTVLAQHPLRPV